MSPLLCPTYGSATQAMCTAETWANCRKHFSHDRAEGFDQTQDLQDTGSTRLRIYKTQDLDSDLDSGSTRLRIYKTCPAYGTVAQHCGEHNVHNSHVSEAPEGCSQWDQVGKTAVTHRLIGDERQLEGSSLQTPTGALCLSHHPIKPMPR